MFKTNTSLEDQQRPLETKESQEKGFFSRSQLYYMHKNNSKPDEYFLWACIRETFDDVFLPPSQRNDNYIAAEIVVLKKLFCMASPLGVGRISIMKKKMYICLNELSTKLLLEFLKTLSVEDYKTLKELNTAPPKNCLNL